MSNRFFSFTGAITHCGPRKVRRTWLSTVANVLVMLALAALSGWLWSCVRHASGLSHGAMSGGGLLAMMPVPELPELEEWQKGCVVGLLAAGTVAALWWVGLRMRRGDEAVAETYWRAVEDAEAFPDTLKREQRTADPLSGAYLGLDAADVRRILEAIIVECCEVEDLVRKAEQDLSVEGYGERLTGARRRLKGMQLCLVRLAARFVPSMPDTLKREQRTLTGGPEA